jgi:hypothetical protein
LYLIFIFLSFFLSARSFAATDETVITLPRAQFSGNATFETLNDDTFVPTEKTSLTNDRASTLDNFKFETPYALQDLGYPGGQTGINIGGRSIEDTQVTTLGIPLNLPEGGGADFAFFPVFLWNEVDIRQTTSSAGFAPSASSGQVEFIPWTRASLVNPATPSTIARAGITYDHDSQAYSFGVKHDDYALLIGTTTGLLTGPSGEASYLVMQNSTGHIFFHVIATDETANSPGSDTLKTPGATLENWRVLPVLETGFHLARGLELQTTAYADINSLNYIDPNTPANSSDTRTHQFGLENAIVKGVDTLALSARFVDFTGASFGELHDFPVYAGLTHEIFLSNESSMKITANGTYENNEGVAPGGKVSFKFASSEKTYPFAEVNTVAKMPTLVDRYSSYGDFFHGNPGLKPERVYAALYGYRYENDHRLFVSTLKGEYRLGIQVATPDYTSVVNGGNAYLFSLNEEASTAFYKWLDANTSALFTYSKLMDSSFSYPDLPYATLTAGLVAHSHEQFAIGAHTRLVGTSAGAGGRQHLGYALFDTEFQYRILKELLLKGGIDNVFNSDGQAILDYTLEGRTYFASLNASF